MNEMKFISLLSELGLRENKSWDESENGLLSKIYSLATEHTNHILEEIKKFKNEKE